MSKFYIIFNDVSTDEVGLNIVQRPIIPSPKQKIKSYDIPGADGTFTEVLGYEDISIDVELNKKCKENFNEFIEKINTWLYHVTDKRLIFSDNLNCHYRVKRVIVDDKNRNRTNYVRFKVTFICEAYKYTDEGRFDLEIQSGAELYNPYYVESFPVLKLYGEGLVSLKVNDQMVEINVGQSIIINSEKRLTYREDGTMSNTSQKGAYPVLQPGKNIIKVINGELDKILIQTNLRMI